MILSKERYESFGKIFYLAPSDSFQLISPHSLGDILDQPLKSPLTAHWVVTMRCNARCPYCYLAPYLLPACSKEDIINVAEAERFIEEFSQNGGVRLYLTGGEPTLSPILEPIIKKAYAEGIKCVINSNGLSISEKQMNLFKDCEVKLSLSLDSCEEIVHNRARNQKSFQKIISHIRQSAESGIDTRVITTWQGGEDLEKFSDFLFSLGVRSWFVQPLLSGDNAENYEKNTNLLAVGEKIRKTHPKMRVKIVSSWYSGFFFILPNGDVGSKIWQPDKKIIGNIRKSGLIDLWEKHDYRFVRDFVSLLKYKRET